MAQSVGKPFATLEAELQQSETRETYAYKSKEALTSVLQFIGDVVAVSADHTCIDREAVIVGTTGGSNVTVTLLDPRICPWVRAVKDDSGAGKLILYSPTGVIKRGNGSTTAHHELVAEGDSVQMFSDGTNFIIF